jgi:hypothetical protein
MLLIIFIIFLCVAIVLTGIGLALDFPVFSLIGTLFIFLLGISMITEPLTYPIGEDINLNYGSNLSNYWVDDGGSIPTGTDAYVLNTNTTALYGSYDDSNTHFSHWLMFGGAFGFIAVLFLL